MPQTDRPDLLGDCRALYLKRLGEALRDCAVLPGAAVARVVASAGDCFDEMIALARRGSFSEQARGLTSSRLTLVADTDLELSLRLDKFAKRLFEATGGTLWKSYLRFITLLARPDLPKDDHPIGPQGIAEGLAAMFVAAEAMPHERKLALVDRLEAALLELLPAIYDEINRFLRDAGVDASQPSIVSSADGAAVRAAPVPVAGGDALSALNQALRSRFAGMPPAAGRPGAAVNREQLNFRLGEFERYGGNPAAPADDAAPRLETLIPGLFTAAPEENRPAARLGARELGVPPTTPDGLLIDALAMIFEAIAGDAERPQVLKSLIARLRVTLIKQALRDDDRLADSRSPSRRWIDLCGRAVLGLPLETPPTHPFCARLLALAERLRAEFDSRPEACVAALGDLEALLGERRAALARHAERFQPIVDLLDRHDQAHAAARQILSRAKAPDTPPEIQAFLDEVWQEVLRKAWLEFGPASVPWQTHSALVGNLLWTFRPKPQAEERKRLAGRLPEVLRQLKAGMEYVELAAEEQSRILDLCFALQTRAMRPQGVAPAGPPPESPRHAGSPREIRLGTVRADGQAALSLDFRQPYAGPPRRPPCRTGDWLRLTVGGRQRVFWVSGLSPAGQRLLLNNPEDEPPLLVHKAILENLFRSDEARIVGNESLFDAAATGALSGLRRKSPG